MYFAGTSGAISVNAGLDLCGHCSSFIRVQAQKMAANGAIAVVVVCGVGRNTSKERLTTLFLLLR